MEPSRTKRDSLFQTSVRMISDTAEQTDWTPLKGGRIQACALSTDAQALNWYRFRGTGEEEPR